jgi:hypothetical protein
MAPAYSMASIDAKGIETNAQENAKKVLGISAF